ncbi:hypothetical protein C3733_08960 [Bacillus amyloliquefaciens]|nr:hypothetical protein C3733_08960 [Bacillus amyloliquefaciens]
MPVRIAHVLIIADSLSEKLSLIIHKFPEKESFLKNIGKKRLAYTAFRFSHLPFGNAFNPFSSSSNAVNE